MDSTDLPVVPAAVGGVVAYVVGYLVTYLWQGPAARETLSGLNTLIDIVGGETIPVWKAVGWLFYNAQGVAVQIPSFGSGTATRNLIGNGGAPTLLYALPPLVLLLAGGIVAWQSQTDGFAEGGVAGAAISIGHVLPAVAGTILFRYAIQEAFVGPPLVRSVLLVGIVYPVVFGAIGGAIGGELA